MIGAGSRQDLAHDAESPTDPLTPDETLGDQYSDRPGFLREIALETGNRALVGIAQAISKEKRRQFKEAIAGRQRAVKSRRFLKAAWFLTKLGKPSNPSLEKP